MARSRLSEEDLMSRLEHAWPGSPVWKDIAEFFEEESDEEVLARVRSKMAEHYRNRLAGVPADALQPVVERFPSEVNGQQPVDMESHAHLGAVTRFHRHSERLTQTGLCRGWPAWKWLAAAACAAVLVGILPVATYLLWPVTPHILPGDSSLVVTATPATHGGGFEPYPPGSVTTARHVATPRLSHATPRAAVAQGHAGAGDGIGKVMQPAVPSGLVTQIARLSPVYVKGHLTEVCRARPEPTIWSELGLGKPRDIMNCLQVLVMPSGTEYATRSIPRGVMAYLCSVAKIPAGQDGCP